MLRAIRIVEGTKITHDDWANNVTYSLDDLEKRRIPAIGIPAKLNDLIIVDVDAGGKVHKFDGRELWKSFAVEAGIPETYSVQTPNGGFHFYFKLPDTINRATFSPRKEIFKGVDIVYNGYVLAPPTKGYECIHGNHSEITTAPVSLLRQVLTRPTAVEDLIGSHEGNPDITHLHTPLSVTQIERLKRLMEWTQLNVSPTYDQWLRGLISLKSGISDQETLEEMALTWTRNQSFQEGDDEKALDVLRTRTATGGIGPGTIFEIIKDLSGSTGEALPLNTITKREILEKAGVQPAMNKQGILVINPNESNIASIISVIPQFSVENLYADTRLDSYIYNGEQIDDAMLVNIITPLLQSPTKGLGFENFRRSNIVTAVEILMSGRRKDPHLDWLNSLVWDGVPRLATFFTKYLFTKDDEYTRTLGLNFWTALAARGINPGCKMDNILIIEGDEGLRKSSLVEAIGGKYYYSFSSSEKVNETEALRKMHQSVIVEIPEFIRLVNQGGNALKATLATSTDRLRDLWAKKAFDRKRGFIYVGTSNLGEYLTEDMGKRRYWPIRIPAHIEGIDIAGLKIDRAQLFAEGVHRYKSGVPYWIMPKELWSDELSQREIKDPLAPVVEDILRGGLAMGVQTHWRVDELYEILNRRELITRGLTKRVSDRIAGMLRSIGADYIAMKENGTWCKKWTFVDRDLKAEVNELI